MKFDIKKIVSIIFVVVLCVCMTIPVAFAATTYADVVLSEGDVTSRLYTADYRYHLVLPNNEQLTIKYLKEHPSYKIDFSWEYANSYDFYLRFIYESNSGGYRTIKDVGKNDGDTVTSYSISASSFTDITEDSEYYESPLIFLFSVDTNYSSSTNRLVTVSSPKPPAGLSEILGAVRTGSSMIFDLISQAYSTIIANPLLLLPIGFSLMAIGFVIFKSLMRS